MTDREIQQLICRYCGNTIHWHEQCTVGGLESGPHPCIKCDKGPRGYIPYRVAAGLEKCTI